MLSDRLKALCIQNGLDQDKVASLITVLGYTVAEAEAVVLGRLKSNDADHLRVRYKESPVVAEKKWTGMGSPPHLNDQKKKKPKKPNYDPASDPMAVMNGADQLKGNRR